ncbi:MAG: hypothetical protein OXC46_00870 [Thaumarchaeota archaeon]|nr:hypothetical protein [Nitrososphaerota archaeon]
MATSTTKISLSSKDDRDRKCRQCGKYKPVDQMVTGADGTIWHRCKECQLKVATKNGKTTRKSKSTKATKQEIKDMGDMMDHFEHTKRVTGFTAGMRDGA